MPWSHDSCMHCSYRNLVSNMANRAISRLNRTVNIR